MVCLAFLGIGRGGIRSWPGTHALEYLQTTIGSQDETGIRIIIIVYDNYIYDNDVT